MDKNIEKEYKILLTKEQFYQLLEFYPTLSFVEQINTYYDTENNEVRKCFGAMRIRTKEKRHTFTLKIPSSEGLEEHECQVNNNCIEALTKKEIHELLATLSIQGPFHEIAKLKTSRAIFANENAELCFDISEYNGTVDYEIEYEYKKEHDGLHAFNAILNKIDVVYDKNCISKIERATKY